MSELEVFVLTKENGGLDLAQKVHDEVCGLVAKRLKLDADYLAGMQNITERLKQIGVESAKEITRMLGRAYNENTRYGLETNYLKLGYAFANIIEADDDLSTEVRQALSEKLPGTKLN